jgi:tetratricopeptide (TPR) repeat protein
MATESHTAPQSAPRGPAPLAPAVRQRLQKTFEHAKRCVEKNDFDYAHQLFTQCVSEDPASIVYQQAMLANLHKKYGNNKKGATFAGLKIKSQRSALNKSAEKGQWLAAFQAGCAALAYNPWDISTLIGMADACNELGIDEAQLSYLRHALDADGKDPTVNRKAALALQRMGQFDQAIACWHRVEQAKPHDEEAQQQISRLSVEKTIHQGGYDPELLGGRPGARSTGSAGGKTSGVARLSRGAQPENSDADPDAPPVPAEQRYKAALEADPANAEHYFRLADIYTNELRLDEAQQILERAAQATGGGNLQVRERLEDLQLRRASHQAAMAQRNFDSGATAEAKALLEKAKAHANQVELEVYATRVDREPNNPRMQFELAMRLKKAGKVKQAITAFQAARSDPKRRALVLVELGECFQKIEQYKLALSHYEQALEVCEPQDTETRKLGLYRAGVLATGLRELDRADRHLSELAGMDFGYRDVSDRLDKVARLRDSG